jgi:tRNA1Val (adenine37-N6)-methyltransferase
MTHRPRSVDHDTLPPGLEPPVEPDELGELSCDAITATFRIHQRKAGHRYSLDDVITAWEAAQVAPQASRCLELGSGVGSVLLMLAYKLPDAQFVAVEAQRNSFALLSRNVADNGLRERVTLVHGDLRSSVDDRLGRFDLITGTPPYVRPGTATPAPDSQKSYCRQEWRGGVEAYLEAAAKVLAPQGKVVVCADARTPERVSRTAERLDLRLLARRDVVPREGVKAPLFSTFVLEHQSATPPSAAAVSHWCARDAAGQRTTDYRAVRSFFGLAGSD